MAVVAKAYMFCGLYAPINRAGENAVYLQALQLFTKCYRIFFALFIDRYFVAKLAHGYGLAVGVPQQHGHFCIGGVFF